MSDAVEAHVVFNVVLETRRLGEIKFDIAVLFARAINDVGVQDGRLVRGANGAFDNIALRDGATSVVEVHGLSGDVACFTVKGNLDDRTVLVRRFSGHRHCQVKAVASKLNGGSLAINRD